MASGTSTPADVLLLDTHAWVWTVEGDVRAVGRRARKLLAEAVARDALRVSAATIFEVVALHTSGRLRLNRPVEQWIDEALQESGARVAECTRATAADAGFIPRTALADPLDRVIVATARQLDALLLTADTHVLAYARQGSVRGQDLRR